MSDAVLVYDDDCGFCTWWARFFEARADVRLVGFSELDPDLRERLPDRYETCSHLVTEDAIYSCGASIEEALLRSDVGAPLRPAVERLRGVGDYRTLREWGYRLAAGNRSLLGRALSELPPARERDSDTDDTGKR